MSESIQDKGRRIAERVFVGGSVSKFEASGRAQLIALLRQGLSPRSKLLDVGCGCLRGGYWCIHFLAPGGYCGIEPNREMLAVGIEELLDTDTLATKKPRFDHNDTFDFSVFGERFDFVLARSVWTHAAKPHIRTMLDQFVEHTRPGAVFLTSYKRPIPVLRPDYDRAEWVGRSHESDEGGIVRHSLRWIRSECAARGLEVRETGQDDFSSQRWLRVARTGD